MKGASWADATEEDEQVRRTAQAQAPQQQSNAPAARPAAAAQGSSYAGRAGGSNAPSSSQSGYGQQQQQQSQGYGQNRGGGQDSRSGGYGQDSRGGGGGYGNQQRDNRGGGGRDGASSYGGYGGNSGYAGNSGGRDGGRDSQQSSQWQRGEQPQGSPRDDRRGGGGSNYNTRNDVRGDSRSGGSSAGGAQGARSGPSQLKPNEDLSTEDEQGIVGQVKDSFGFISCADRDGEIFFHFSDVGGQRVLRRGDEVSFRVATDSRDGRTRALQVEQLPKGSVQSERIVEEAVRGVVTKELMGQYKANPRDRRQRGTLADSLAQGRQEAYGGKVKRTDVAAAADSASSSAAAGASSSAAAAAPAASSSSDVFEFSERDLVDPNIVLYVGDILEFSIFIERKSKRRGATRVRLIEPNPLGRERGTVVSIKDNFGFIQLEEQIEEDDDGSSHSQQQQYGNRGGGYHNQQQQQIFFHFSELMDSRRLPNVGDELSFRVDKSPAEGNKVSAQRVALLPKGSINSREIAKEVSTGVVVKEITYEAPQQQQGAEQKQPPQAEPASSPAASPTATGASADVPNPLARGDAASSSNASSSSRVPQQRLKMVPGLVSYTDASGSTVELPFRPSDLHSANRNVPVVLKGDTASFHLLTLRTRGGVVRRATQLSVSSQGWAREGREQGVVGLVREGGFGFIDCVSRQEKVFLHMSQLKQMSAHQKRDENPRGGEKRTAGTSGEGLFVGMEVEFNLVQTEPGKLSATRAVVLPQGSVSFEELLPYTFTGVIGKSIKVRPPLAPPAQKDGSSAFSKNDLRREQGNAPAGGREGKGEKGEIKHLALGGDSIALAADIVLPTKEGVPFFDLDVVPPAAPNLDTTSLLVGDVVSLQLKRHKASKKLSAAQVQLQQMNPSNREKGQVTRIVSEREGLGQITTASRSQPLLFFLKDAPRPAGQETIRVGDCFEFNVSEANAGSKKDRERHPQHRGANNSDQAFAVRLTPLERGSVEVGESVDRSRRLRGFISAMPEKASAPGAKGKQSTAARPGTIIVLPSDRSTAITNPSLSHPASWNLEASAAWATYSAGGIHAASITTEAQKSEGEEKYPFTLRELNLASFLNKGDLLDFYLSVRTQPTVVKRPVEFGLVPLQGTITSLDEKSGTGNMMVYNPQAQRSEEVFVFNLRDVQLSAPAADGSSSSASATDSVPLAVGDYLEFSDMVLNAEQKKRQAKNIVRAKDNRPAELRPGTKRRAGAPIVAVSRFARGPDKEGFGFAAGWRERRALGASPSPQPSPSPSPSP